MNLDLSFTSLLSGQGAAFPPSPLIPNFHDVIIARIFTEVHQFLLTFHNVYVKKSCVKQDFILLKLIKNHALLVEKTNFPQKFEFYFTFILKKGLYIRKKT